MICELLVMGLSVFCSEKITFCDPNNLSANGFLNSAVSALAIYLCCVSDPKGANLWNMFLLKINEVHNHFVCTKVEDNSVTRGSENLKI